MSDKDHLGDELVKMPVDVYVDGDYTTGLVNKSDIPELIAKMVKHVDAKDYDFPDKKTWQIFYDAALKVAAMEHREVVRLTKERDELKAKVERLREANADLIVANSHLRPSEKFDTIPDDATIGAIKGIDMVAIRLMQLAEKINWLLQQHRDGHE